MPALGRAAVFPARVRLAAGAAAVGAALVLAVVLPVEASSSAAPEGKQKTLPDLAALKSIEGDLEDGGANERAAERRGAAQRLAALAWSSQAGLALRGRELAELLEKRGSELSKIFNFGTLMLHRGGFMVMPPVLAETRDAIRITDGRAASARRVLRISAGERLVGAPPGWRDWLRREWEPARRPSPVLFPRDDAERKRWDGWLDEGWNHGVRLADDIYASDLERLTAAFEGVVRWHRLHLASMVTAPETVASRTAVSGDERLLRIDELVVRLDERARFNLAPGEWEALPEPLKPAGGSGRRQ